MKAKFFFLLVAVSLMNFYSETTAQIISRGATNGEIYISTPYYFENLGEFQWGIFRSTDNGEYLSLQYHSPSPQNIFGEPFPGRIFSIWYDTTLLSENYGVTWPLLQNNLPVFLQGITAGADTGEVYFSDFNTAYRSTDYGQTFVSVNDTFTNRYILEVGVQPGEIYARNIFNNNFGNKLFISHDYGHAFYYQPIDTSTIADTILFWSGYLLARGNSNEEFYLIKKDTGFRYHIFQTIDDGKTFYSRSITMPMGPGLEWDDPCFSGGVAPGVFYVCRERFDGSTFFLCIDYSCDSAQTFTTYCYDLSTFVTTNNLKKDKGSALSQNVPNPFRSETIIRFDLEKTEYVQLFILNIHGQIIRQLVDRRMLPGKQTVTWDGRDNFGNRVPPGVYYYCLKSEKCYLGTKKMIVLQ